MKADSFESDVGVDELLVYVWREMFVEETYLELGCGCCEYFSLGGFYDPDGLGHG